MLLILISFIQFYKQGHTDQIALGNWKPSEALVKTLFFPPTLPKGLLLSNINSVTDEGWKMSSFEEHVLSFPGFSGLGTLNILNA